MRERVAEIVRTGAEKARGMFDGLRLAIGRQLLWTAGGGLLAGMLLWSFLPGVILRALPQSWQMPESMAAHIVGEPTLWDAGARLMQADSPQAWNSLNQAAEMLRDNRETIEQCQATSKKAKGRTRCTVEIALVPRS